LVKVAFNIGGKHGKKRTVKTKIRKSGRGEKNFGYDGREEVDRIPRTSILTKTREEKDDVSRQGWEELKVNK